MPWPWRVFLRRPRWPQPPRSAAQPWSRPWPRMPRMPRPRAPWGGGPWGLRSRSSCSSGSSSAPRDAPKSVAPRDAPGGPRDEGGWPPGGALMGSGWWAIDWRGICCLTLAIYLVHGGHEKGFSAGCQWRLDAPKSTFPPPSVSSSTEASCNTFLALCKVGSASST